MSSNFLRSKVDQFLNDRKNGNNIIEIWNIMKNDERKIVPCICALEKLFSKTLERKDYYIDETLKLTQPEKWEVENEYVQWLTNTYNKTFEKMCEYIESEKKEVQDQALTSAMKLINKESLNPIVKKGEFPIEKLQRVMRCLLSAKTRRNDLIMKYKGFYVKSIVPNTWMVLAHEIPLIKDLKDDIFMSNALDLLEAIAPPKKEKMNTEKNKLCKLMTQVWQGLINKYKSLALHRRLLIIFLESYLHRLDSPIFFTDFFMASMNLGGANSLLALQGMLVLIQKFNLEYPNVYAKLYTMFEPEIFHTKYKARLFYLADLFLTSTHLPGALVAAFAKRASRLALTAQVPDIVIILRFVGNLLIRHNVLIKMIHNSELEEVPEDPFLMDEPDPMKSRAIESSLWELSLLKNHVQPVVSKAGRFIDHNLQSIEFDLSEVLENSSKDVFEDETTKTNRSLTFYRPQGGIAKLNDDRLYKMWDLT